MKSFVVGENSDDNHNQDESGEDEQYDVNVRRANPGHVHRHEIVAAAGRDDGLRSACRRGRSPLEVDCAGSGKLKPGDGVDGAGLQVGAAVAAPAAGRRRPAGRTAPVLDAFRLRLVG